MITYLDGPRLRRAFRAAAAHLLAQEDLLNRINVFPVPDGDTGTNLALTVKAMLPVLNHSDTKAADRSLTEIADAALDGARGNSGAILAQFLHGVSDAVAGISRLKPKDLADAFDRGANYARDAIEEPREGTMLSVFSALADEMRKVTQSKPGWGFARCVHQLLPRLDAALVGTKEQLQALKKADVVDAGAAGVVAMAKGVLNLLNNRSSLSIPEPLLEAAAPKISAEQSDEKYRFCTECFVDGVELDHRALRETLTTRGNSLVVAGSRSRAKIHIHTNNPEEVFNLARGFGQVNGEKADDMTLQAHSVTRAGKLAIITDSAADLPEDQARELNIHSVPLRIHIGNRSYLDKVSLSCEELYTNLVQESGRSKTSQPAPGDFRRMYEFLASHFEEVLSVQLTGTVSGTLQAARQAAGRTEPPGTVSVIDTRNCSLGQGLLVMLAAEMAAEGKNREQVVAALSEAIGKVNTFAVVRDLSHAVRGGRVGPGAKRAADLLRITPVIHTTPTGEVKAGKFYFGRNRTVERFSNYLLKQLDAHRARRLAVGHGQAKADARELEGRLTDAMPNLEQSYFTEIGAAVGVHAGPGTLVVAVLND